MHSGRLVEDKCDEDEIVARIVEEEILAEDESFEREITKRVALEQRYAEIKRLKGERNENCQGESPRKKALEELLYALLREERIPEFKANGIYKVNDVVKIRSSNDDCKGSDDDHEYAYGVVLEVNENRIEVVCCDYGLGTYVDRELALTPESRQITEGMQDKRFIIRDKTYGRNESYKLRA